MSPARGHRPVTGLEDEQRQPSTGRLRWNPPNAARAHAEIKAFRVGIGGDRKLRASQRSNRRDCVPKQLCADPRPQALRPDPHMLQLEGRVCTRHSIEADDHRPIERAKDGMVTDEIRAYRQILLPQRDELGQVVPVLLGGMRNHGQLSSIAGLGPPDRECHCAIITGYSAADKGEKASRCAQGNGEGSDTHG